MKQSEKVLSIGKVEFDAPTYETFVDMISSALEIQPKSFSDLILNRVH